MRSPVDCVPNRMWTRYAAAMHRDRRDRDRHDVAELIAHGIMLDDERAPVVDRGLYEHVGRARRTERKWRYLAGAGEYDESQYPF